jgi:ATP-dependent Clp protease adaptor protein ClpS
MADTKTDATVKPRIEPKLDLAPPTLFKVIYINDEVTTMEFVVESLRSVFDYETEDAHGLCMQVHEEGSAVVATLPYEIAEQKGIEVTVLARNNGFPLQVKLEPDN